MADQVKIEIWSLDNRGLPNTLIASSEYIDYSEIEYDGFYTFTFSSPVSIPDLDKKYAIILVDEGTGDKKIGWITTDIDTYEDGYILKGIPWQTETDRDHYFRVYYVAPSTPTRQTQNIQFNKNKLNRLVVNNNEELCFDPLFVVSICVDCSGTMYEADSSEITKDGLVYCIREILQRAPLSYVDIWSVKNSIEELTSGLSRDIEAIEAAIYSYEYTGQNSNIIDALEATISNANNANIISAIQQDTTAYIEELLSWNRINLEELKEIDASFDDSDPLNSIINNTNILNYVLNDISESYNRIFIILTDGNDAGSTNNTENIIDAIYSVNNKIYPLYCFLLGRNTNPVDLQDISIATEGKIFDNITNITNLESCFDSIFDGEDSIFIGSCEDEVLFSDTTYLEEFTIAAEEPSSSDITVEVSLIYEDDSYSDWQTLSINDTTYINKFVKGFKYRIKMQLGNIYGRTFYKEFGEYPDITFSLYKPAEYPVPKITSFSYSTISPAISYYFTEPVSVQSDITEVILATKMQLSDKTKITWGIVRGNSADFAEAEHIQENKRNVLVDRKNNIYFTKDISIIGLTGVMVDQLGYIYYLIDDKGEKVLWTENDEVTLYVDNQPLNRDITDYQLDNKNGYIWFSSPIEAGKKLTANIVRKGELSYRQGEIAYNLGDNRTYIAINGPWPRDATATVRVNNQIIKSGYRMFPQFGYVVFNRELENDDIVTIEIEHEKSFRACCEVKNYDINNDDIEVKFAMMYSLSPETMTKRIIELSDPPVASSVKLRTMYRDVEEGEDVITVSITDRLFVSYIYSQAQGNPEQDTIIKWYYRRYGSSTFTEYEDYRNRTTMRESDIPANSQQIFREGDSWYVTITPYDGTNYGQEVISNIVVIGNEYRPYIAISEDGSPLATISAEGNITRNQDNDLVSIKQDLIADFVYIDPLDTTSDSSLCIVRWYKNKEEQVLYEGKILPASYINPGDVIYYTVIPYNGHHYGDLVFSEEVIISGMATT